jgi:hypothetical protein
MRIGLRQFDTGQNFAQVHKEKILRGRKFSDLRDSESYCLLDRMSTCIPCLGRDNRAQSFGISQKKSLSILTIYRDMTWERHLGAVNDPSTVNALSATR